MESSRSLLFFLLLLFAFSPVKSNTYDSLQVSLLTVAPRSKAVWTIFGHTALRLYDPVHNIDMVFNWGTFDNSRPDFIPRFIKGETDYFLSVTSFQSFIPEYVYDQVEMIEQILNIPDIEKGNLLNFLQIIGLPQNVEYRYNFVFDNCTTRPRDIIEQFCGATMVYPNQMQPVTFRQLFHQYTHSYPWLELGIDCIIGSGADSLISYRNELFLPEKLMDALNRSVVKSQDGDEQPVVTATKVILQNKVKQVHLNFWSNPFAAGIVVLIIYLAGCFLSLRAIRSEDPQSHDNPNGMPRKSLADRLLKLCYNLPFAFLFFVAGTGGCIVAMLHFFSVHPCVQSNWNLLWLHPMHFIACVGFFFRKSYRWIRWYHALNFVLLSGFLLGWQLIPQELNKAFIPFILCLWVVSGFQLLQLKRKKE